MADILVVDDSASIRDFVGTLLQQHGHTIATADDGRSALAQLRARMFDVLITDLYMPGVDGLELILHCRTAGILPKLIAISSAGARVDLLPAARAMGASHTLKKPFTKAQLLHATDSVLHQAAPGGWQAGQQGVGAKLQ